MAVIGTGEKYRFLVTLINGDEELAAYVDTDDNSFVAVRNAVRANYSPCWKIYESLLVWENCF
jgi:hypothetical protein